MRTTAHRAEILGRNALIDNADAKGAVDGLVIGARLFHDAVVLGWLDKVLVFGPEQDSILKEV